MIVIMTAVNKNMLSGKASHCFISKIVDRSTSLIGQLFPFIFFCRNGSKFSVGICVQKKPVKMSFLLLAIVIRTMHEQNLVASQILQRNYIVYNTRINWPQIEYMSCDFPTSTNVRILSVV